MMSTGQLKKCPFKLIFNQGAGSLLITCIAVSGVKTHGLYIICQVAILQTFNYSIRNVNAFARTKFRDYQRVLNFRLGCSSKYDLLLVEFGV